MFPALNPKSSFSTIFYSVSQGLISEIVAFLCHVIFGSYLYQGWTCIYPKQTSTHKGLLYITSSLTRVTLCILDYERRLICCCTLGSFLLNQTTLISPLKLPNIWKSIKCTAVSLAGQVASLVLLTENLSETVSNCTAASTGLSCFVLFVMVVTTLMLLCNHQALQRIHCKVP